MLEKFIDRAFKPDSLRIIEQANEIIDSYQRRGFTLTLRQLYYQFVSKALIANKQTEYKRLGGIIDDGRKAGLIDWAAIEDRTRELEVPTTWSSPQSIVRAVAQQYQENPWLKQTRWPEVWIEKDALTGVIEPVCTRMRVPYISCRGYMSSSEVYAAGKRLEGQAGRGRRPVVLHLGDHDPSGLQMTEDITDRLHMFARMRIKVDRLALNMDQVQQYNPPPNPLKTDAVGQLTDSRGLSYQDEFGGSSWELDALDPDVIEALIQSALDELIDPEPWAASMAHEEKNKHLLETVSNEWERVVEMLGDEPE